ncbi:hypothetical protein [Bacillus sp. AFS017336]|uniref:hypothetical protein n=1 Tax=Bacillus sp. AFS017336 TaxID=2033489 RepID=UPI000BF15E30|nr:hypothetical protein [Bacillus sp. AFS017336]PEL05647.1 hypothetical protein CN601_21590 [Bacillus sp. AFS017336]
MKVLNNYCQWLFKKKSYRDLSDLITTSLGVFLLMATDFFSISSDNIVIPIILIFVMFNTIFLLEDIFQNLLGSKNRDIPLIIFGIILVLIFILLIVIRDFGEGVL